MDNFHNKMHDNLPNQAAVEPDIPLIETSKDKHKRLFRRGCTWLGIGVMILGLSFGITFILFQTDKSFMIVMYVLTSIGATCVIKGLVDIIG